MPGKFRNQRQNNKRYKLACFDLDGTIIDETVYIWQTIHQCLHTDNDERKECMKRYYNNEISYEEWAYHDVELWKRAGATKKDILRALSNLKLMFGAKDTLYELKSRGLKLAIISGSLNIAIEKVLPKYKEIFDYVFINEIFFDKKDKIKKIIPTKYDMVHKATALQEICEKERIRIQDTIFVGDNDNDVQVAKIAGLAISFNSKSAELDRSCHVVIKRKDLKEILKYT